MKRKYILMGCVAVLLLAGLTAIAFAAQSRSGDPTVVLDGAARQFEFQNVTPYTGNNYPNLFQNEELTAMMPGDAVEEEIIVTAKNLNGGYADIYLSAESINDDITPDEAAAYEFLMNNAALSVTCTDKTGSIRTLALTMDGERVQLGKFSERDSVTITVNFSIPITAGNDLQNLRAEIGWVFQAEIYENTGPGPGPGPSPSPSPGGDDGPSVPMLNTKDHMAYIIGRPGGMIYPEADITRAEVATVFFRLLTDESRARYWAESSPYPDVLSDDWFNNEISTLTKAGILKGRPDGTFGPDEFITRAEVAVICTRFFDTDVRDKTFPDIEGHWGQKEIEIACSSGILYGYPDGTYRPDQPITRAEFFAIVNRMLNRVAHKDHLHADMICWPDNMDTDMWYYADVQEATNSHLYSRKQGDTYEVWTKILPPPDWKALELEWSKLYGSSRQVVDSRTDADYR